ncbi:MAG: hypothetical protein FWG35_03215, partial [Spirochaetaceae bacterium]|nr:hypothetical protein [Spirochaetaceae bacterium]
MKRKMFFCFIVLMLVGITCLSAQMTKKQLQDMYVGYLKAEGYQPSVDSDGDVNFTAQGQKFYIDVWEKDLQIFRIMLSGFLDIGSDRQKALEAATRVTATSMVARTYIASNNKVQIDAFIFIGKPDDFKLHIKR